MITARNIFRDIILKFFLMLYKIIKDYDFVIFDLDNTIYDEFYYVETLYSIVYKIGYVKNHLSFGEFKSALLECYINYGNQKLIENIYKYMKIDDEQHCLSMDIKLLKTTFPIINVPKFSWFVQLQQHFMFDRSLLVTNGQIDRQRRKVHCLKLDTTFSNFNIIYESEGYKKPDPRILKRSKFNFSGTDKIIVVGDSAVDEEFSLSLGADFLKIKFERNHLGFCVESTFDYEHHQ